MEYYLHYEAYISSGGHLDFQVRDSYAGIGHCLSMSASVGCCRPHMRYAAMLH